MKSEVGKLNQFIFRKSLLHISTAHTLFSTLIIYLATLHSLLHDITLSSYAPPNTQSIACYLLYLAITRADQLMLPVQCTAYTPCALWPFDPDPATLVRHSIPIRDRYAHTSLSVFVIRPSVLRVHSHRSTAPRTPHPAPRTPHTAPTPVDSLHERRVVDIPAAGFPELGGDQREIVVAEVQVEEVQNSSELQFGDHARVGGRPVEVLEVRVDEDSTPTHLIAKSAHDVDAPRFVVADEGEALTGQTGRVWGTARGREYRGGEWEG